jgi:hypothetical protein
MAPILKNIHASTATKRAIYNAIFLLTLFFQFQTWTMTAKFKSKITTIEMRFLRRIDRIKNVDIRSRVDGLME